MGTGKFNAGCNSAMDLHSILGDVEIFLVSSCYRNWGKLWPKIPLVCMQTLPFFTFPVTCVQQAEQKAIYKLTQCKKVIIKYLDNAILLVILKEHTIVAVAKTVARYPPPSILSSLSRHLCYHSPLTKVHFKVLERVVCGDSPSSVLAWWSLKM